MDMDRTVIQTLSGETLFQAIPSAEQLQFIVASSIGSTLSTLYRLDSAELPSNSDALERGVIALLPPDAPANNRPQEEFLSALTLGANDAASSTACGSILAGQTSESDEYGDIAFWLGEGNFNKGNEKAVIKALGLQFWLSQETKIVPVRLSTSTHLPLSVRAPPSIPSVAALVTLLSRFDDLYAFNVEPLGESMGFYACFLVGHCLTEAGTPGWAGLVGVGVWT